VDAEENELYELHTELERAVGAKAATTLMRHLSPTEWPEVATKADLNAMQDRLASKADLELAMARLESAMVHRLNQQTLTMTFALITVVLAIASMAFAR
jgi:hypothetical protein